MAYAERSMGVATTERAPGAILTSAGSRLHQADHINRRLTCILDNLRQSGPQAIGGRADDVPEPRRPLADLMERIEHAQAHTFTLLDEIETHIG